MAGFEGGTGNFGADPEERKAKNFET